jgi:hypothetical protein
LIPKGAKYHLYGIGIINVILHGIGIINQESTLD